MLNNQIKTLLDKEMDRREFLLTVFKGVIIFFGFSALIRGMLQATQHKSHSASLFSATPAEAKHGFGNSRFGI